MKFLIDAGQDAQQRTFAGSVQADDADLRAVEIGEVDVLEDRFLVVILADSDHRVDDFVRNCAHVGGVDKAVTICAPVKLAETLFVSDSCTSNTVYSFVN